MTGGRVLVVGMGSSGRAMAAALQRTGRPVRAADERTDLDVEGLPTDTRLGPMTESLLTDVAMVATSPGIPRPTRC